MEEFTLPVYISCSGIAVSTKYHLHKDVPKWIDWYKKGAAVLE